jgi:hypothetical protein
VFTSKRESLRRNSRSGSVRIWPKSVYPSSMQPAGQQGAAAQAKLRSVATTRTNTPISMIGKRSLGQACRTATATAEPQATLQLVGMARNNTPK